MHDVRAAWRAGLCLLGGLGLAGCGGRTSMQTDATGADASAFSAHAPCTSSDGVRLCGGSLNCPPISPPSCPGYGCTAARDDVTDVAAAGGVCWADLPDNGSTSCAICDDGEECVERASQELVCVSPAVCAALWDDGVRDVCRYADKSQYDHRPLRSPSGTCPVDPSQHWACGGACGACPEGQHCVGRSPDHPFGICTWPPAPTLPDGAPCAIGPGGARAPWCDPFDTSNSNTVCAVFHVDPTDQNVAMAYGICVPRTPCLALASTLPEGLPGGLDCYDATGRRLNQ